MTISAELKDEIKSKVDLGTLVSSYGITLKPKSGALWGCCPFHNEKTPSFEVDVTRGTYHCFGCGESGDAIEFVKKMEGLSFGDAIRKLASNVGVEIKVSENAASKARKKLYALMAQLAIDFNKMLKSPAAGIAREYLASRQLDSTMVDKFLIGYAPKDVVKILKWATKHGYTDQDLIAAGVIKASDNQNRPPYFYFSDRLVFSIKDKNGQVVAFSGRQLVEDKKSGKYINSPETSIFKKSRTFFAFDEARKHIVKATNREAIICEGQIDCIRLHSVGFNTAVAPLGTAFTEDHAVMLHRVADTALLCFDDDGAGYKATIRAAQILLAEGMPIRVLSLPDGDDPDSYILKHGKEGFESLIGSKAETIVQFQIRAARADEPNPEDPNAATRITDSVLGTISKCKDKVHRTFLLKEAAKSLGIEYATLLEKISNTVKTSEEVSLKTAEELIEPIVGGNAADVNNPPSVAEGALINFLLTKKDDKKLKADLSKLIPIDVFGSNTARKIVNGIMTFEDGDKDSIREAVDGLSTDEYKTFIAIMANFDGTEFSNISEKMTMLYFARQVWHDYLVRLLKTIGKDNADLGIIVNALKDLNTATSKGIVHLILTFPRTKFAKVA